MANESMSDKTLIIIALAITVVGFIFLGVIYHVVRIMLKNEIIEQEQQKQREDL